MAVLSKEKEITPIGDDKENPEEQHLVDLQLVIFEKKLADREMMLKRKLRGSTSRYRLKLKIELRKNKKAQEMYKDVWDRINQWEEEPTEENEKIIDKNIEIFQRYISLLDPKLPLFVLEEDINSHIVNCAQCYTKYSNATGDYEEPVNVDRFENPDQLARLVKRDVSQLQTIPPKFSIADVDNLRGWLETLVTLEN